MRGVSKDVSLACKQEFFTRRRFNPSGQLNLYGWPILWRYKVFNLDGTFDKKLYYLFHLKSIITKTKYSTFARRLPLPRLDSSRSNKICALFLTYLSGSFLCFLLEIDALQPMSIFNKYLHKYLQIPRLKSIWLSFYKKYPRRLYFIQTLK